MKIISDLTLDKENISETAILHDPFSTNRIRTRIGAMAKLFFFNRNGLERRAILDAAHQYLSLPECKTTHFMTNAGKRTPLQEERKVPDYFLDMLARPENEDTQVDIYEDLGGDYYSIPLWHILGTTFGLNNPTRELSGMEAHFPSEYLLGNCDQLLLHVIHWCRVLRVEHGSFGLSVLGTPGSELSTSAFWYPWMRAYPCLDYGSRGVYWSATRRGGFESPFTSNWLTILGDANISRLGGEAAIHSQLTEGMSFIPYDGGGIIRATDKPALGNEASGGIPEGYRTAARIIKPIRFEGYKRGIIKTPKELNYSREQDLQVTLDWIRRFD